MSENHESASHFTQRLFAFSLGPIGSAILGFISVPVTTWLLVPEQLGRASMYTTASGFMSMLIFLGLDSAFVREFHSGIDRKSLLQHTLYPPLAVSLLLGVASYLFLEPISILLFGDVDPWSVFYLALSLPIHVLLRFARNIVRMEERAAIYSINEVLEKAIRIISLVLFLTLVERSYQGVLFASVASQLTALGFLFSQTFKYWRPAIPGDMALYRRLLAFGLPLVPAALLSWLANSIDKIALRSFSTFDQIGIYAGAFKVVNVLVVARKSFNSFWVPTAYRWYEQGVGIRRFQRVTDAVMAYMAVAYSGIVLVREAVFLLLGPEYAPSAALVPFLLFIPIMMTASESTVIGIQFKRKSAYHVLIASVVGSVNVTGNLILVPRFGALGAAISTGLSFVVFYWMRTLLSNLVWERLRLGRILLNTCLMVVLSSIAFLFTGFVGKLIEGGLALVIVVVNFGALKEGFGLFKDAVSGILGRKKKR